MHVRKFGADYEITEVTDIEDPVDVHLTITVKAADGTTLGSRTGGGAFVAGSTVTAQGCYIVASASGDVGTLPADLDITTDVDSPLTVVLTGEDIADGGSMNFYISSTGSTYYDEEMMYGGGRHTPDGTAQFPYFDITTALAALGGAFTIVTVLDSETYDEELTISGAYTLQAALGETPTITRGIGARVTREVEHDGNNADTCYVSKEIGSDVTGDGTYQNPYATITTGYTNIGARTYLDIMDDDSYEEQVTITGAISIEPIYGKCPVWCYDTVNAGALLIQNKDCNIYGIIFDSRDISAGIMIYRVAAGANVNIINDNSFLDCNIYGISFNQGGFDQEFAGDIINNKFQNCVYGIFFSSANPALILGLTGNVNDNYFYANGEAIYLYASGFILQGNIQNNVFSKNIDFAIDILKVHNLTGDISNNTIYDSTLGISAWVVNSFTGTIDNNLLYDNSTYDLQKTAGVALTITNSRYGTNSGFTIGAGCITTDPKLCDENNNILGLSADSPCLGTGASDMGCENRIINFASDDIVLNGFNMSGQNYWHNAIYQSATRDSCLINWCSIYDFNGIAIYDYGTGAAVGSELTNTEINNCKIYNNGNGVKFVYGGNTIQETVIYNCSIFGAHGDYAIQIIDHCVFYGNQYGIYFESNSAGILLKNSIFNQNSLYGVYSESSVILRYCCITDGYNSYVTIDPADDYHNITDLPLFVNMDEDTEDFNIKTIYNGYKINSSCMGGADDGYDIGAYKLTRSIEDDSWRRYELAHNPRTIDFQNLPKGEIKFENILGSLDLYVKDMKRSFIFKWPATQYTTEELKDKVEYFNTLVKSRVNNFTDEDVKLRIQFLPDQKLETGTSGVVSATGKSLTDQTQQWTENKWKGFWVGLEFTSGTDMVMDATAKTGTKDGAGWTTNQWTGYYLPLNGYWYYIKSNTATVLTLSDLEETLEDETVAYSIEKYFRVNSNTSTVLYLDDADGELVAGSYDYYIDFIECVIQKPEMKYTQTRYYYQQETWKNNFQLMFEEA
jgi:hypothetical protein